MTEPEKLPLTSMDIADQRRQELKALFPSVFAETQDEKGELVESIDFEKLKAELGTFSDVFESRRERYGMDWPGKKDCMKIIQASSAATIRPRKEKSVDFDNAKHVFIEGDNLEVLKLLQKPYYGKVKLIFIDPPYNTGKEFIYPDNFSESLETYLNYAGLADDQNRRFSSNTSSEGRYHTRWLRMMHPRLYLAKQLLSEDGIICISIDDNESANLRKLCDELFGEENFIANVAWKHTQQSKNDEKYFSRQYNSILVYGKSQAVAPFKFPRTKEDNKNYSNPDADPMGDWRSGDVRSPHYRQNLCFSISTPSGKTIAPPENGWRWSEPEVMKKINSGEIIFNEDETRVVRKIYLANQDGRKPENLWQGELYGTTRAANAEIKQLFDGKTVFDTPKPTALIKRLLHLIPGNDYIILDFFAGSGTTADAVLSFNAEEKKNIRFLTVQLPEPCDETSESFKLGFETIADLAVERIRRKGQQIKETFSDANVAFKCFSLRPSNFSRWVGDPRADDVSLQEQLSLHIDHIDPEASDEDILCEILLKAGFALDEHVEQLTLASTKMYSIAEGALLIHLEDEITREQIDAVAEAEPMQFICLDRAFKGNDQLKANAVQTFAARNQGREKAEQIIFRTV